MLFCAISQTPPFVLDRTAVDNDNVIPKQLSPEVLSAIQAVRFIAQHIKDADKDNEVSVVVVIMYLLLRWVGGADGAGREKDAVGEEQRKKC